MEGVQKFLNVSLSVPPILPKIAPLELMFVAENGSTVVTSNRSDLPFMEVSCDPSHLSSNSPRMLTVDLEGLDGKYIL